MTTTGLAALTELHEKRRQRRQQKQEGITQPAYAILIVYPDGHVHLNVRRPRWANAYPPNRRQRTYRHISTASLCRLDHLIRHYASYTGTTQPDNAFVALLDLPS